MKVMKKSGPSARHKEEVYMNKRYLININTGGRLGNHLNAFAWMMEISRRTGAVAINPGFAPYKNLFEGPSQQKVAFWPPSFGFDLKTRLMLLAFNRHFLFAYHPLRITQHWRLDELKPLLLGKSRLFADIGFIAFDWVVDGRHAANPLRPTIDQLDYDNPDHYSNGVLDYIQSKKIILIDGGVNPRVIPRGIVDDVRKYFKPRQDVANQAQVLIDQLRLKADIIVGVSIRQGDFRFWEGGKWFVDPKNFRRIVELFTQRLKPRKCALIVCSDDSIDAKLFDGFDVIILPANPLKHLSALMGCDYIIGTCNSTFIHWASILGNVPLYSVSQENLTHTPDLSDFRVFGIEE